MDGSETTLCPLCCLLGVSETGGPLLNIASYKLHYPEYHHTQNGSHQIFRMSSLGALVIIVRIKEKRTP